MKTFLKLLVGLVLVLVLVAFGGYAWASGASSDALGRTIETHEVDFPVPYPAPEAETVTAAVASTGATELDLVAAAVARGEHLVEARYACADCHGADLSGGVMMDAMPMGRFLGPNLTLGEGSVTADYTPADWDRAVRHGVGPDGRPLVMPAQDFQRMSDRELSDIVAYLRSLPAVDNEVTPVTLGPVGKLLIARGTWQFSADVIPSHDTPHAGEPPPAAPDETFGRHVAATCVGCHKSDYSGGDIGGDPNWAPAANLTAAGNLPDYSLDDFVKLMREGVRPDGSTVLEPMTFVLPLARNMTDLELEAMYVFLRSLPARETAQ